MTKEPVSKPLAVAIALVLLCVLFAATGEPLLIGLGFIMSIVAAVVAIIFGPLRYKVIGIIALIFVFSIVFHICSLMKRMSTRDKQQTPKMALQQSEDKQANKASEATGAGAAPQPQR